MYFCGVDWTPSSFLILLIWDLSLFFLTNLMDMDFSKRWDAVEDRRAWGAAVHGVTEGQTWLSDWTTTATTSFFSWWVWLKVYQFYLFKEPAFSFIVLFCCHLFPFTFKIYLLESFALHVWFAQIFLMAALCKALEALNWELASFSCKYLDSKYFRLCGSRKESQILCMWSFNRLKYKYVKM